MNKWLDVSEMADDITLYAGWEPVEEEQLPVIPDDPQKPDDPTVKPDPDKPGDGGSDSEQNTGDDQKTPAGTQTGDDTNMTAVVIVMIAALISCLTALLARRRKS